MVVDDRLFGGTVVDARHPVGHRIAALLLATTGLTCLVLAPLAYRQALVLGVLAFVAGATVLPLAWRLARTDSLGSWGWAASAAAGSVVAGASGRLGPAGLFALLAGVVVVILAVQRLAPARLRPVAAGTTALLLVGAVLTPGAAFAWGGGGGGGTGCANSGCTTAFATALPIPPVAAPASSDATTDYYTLTEKQATAALVPAGPTPVWTYNGSFPGPTIKARSGRAVKIHVVNQDLPEPTTVHMHGAHVPAVSDGSPVATFGAGASFDYTYPNNQSARIQWYHDHAVDQTGKHVYMGLAGEYLISDPQEDALGLPGGAYDVPLVVQDRTFNTDGSFQYVVDSAALRTGFLGDTVLVNGAVQPFYRVDTHRYRFRLLNGSNARYYTFALSNGQAMSEIGNEAGLFSAPISATSITLPPAGRADVVVDFGAAAVGSSIVLRNTQGSGSTADVMRFDVTNKVTDTSRVPSALRPFTPLDPAKATVSRTFTIDQDRNGMWTFNGLGYDPKRIDAQVKLGALEKWTFQNRSGVDHPIHLHDINFQVVSDSGWSRSAPADESQWKETVNVPAWGSVTVLGQFTDYTGTFMFHCHILEHEDMMLMAQFAVS